MKAFTAEYIARIAKEYKQSELFIVEDNEEYNRMLRIVIPGVPVSDSRPRFVFKTKTTFNPHKEQLMRLFKVLYDSDPILKGTYIYTPMTVHMNYYMPISKTLKGENLLLAQQSKLSPLTVKDNDNIEKVHWDVMQEFIFMDDKLITANYTKKHFGMEPRIEIKIYYNTDFTNSYHRATMMKSKTFKNHMLFDFCMRKKTDKDSLVKHLDTIMDMAKEMKLKRADITESLKKMSLQQLKWLCQHHKLPVGGKKPDLVMRLNSKVYYNILLK